MNFEKIQYLTMSNLRISNMTQVASNAKWILIIGKNTELSLNQVTFLSTHLYKSPAISLVGAYTSITMNSLYFDNILTDTSIIHFESLRALKMGMITFTNIKNYAPDSVNNYMIKIQQAGN